ncbi:hypothetical protein Q9966_004895 [Columba livia]|nr:hypothetical protein Q9966_004895 [Columba livia]
MRSEANYNAYTNNCIHFALSFLGLEKFSSELRKSVSLKFLFTKSIPGHGEIFEQVLSGTLQPGDILLFPLDGSNSTIAQALLRHAAVFCGNGEVIHFQGIDCKESPGVISKEGLVKMRKNRGPFDVYRKKDGVVLKEFNNRVRTAMNSKAKYDPYTNNCIHFALYLLGLQEFYSNLVSTELVSRPRWDGSCTHPQPCVCILT